MNTSIPRPFPYAGAALLVAMTAAFLAWGEGISQSHAASIVVIKPANPLPLDRLKIIGDARFRPRSVQLKRSVKVTLFNSLTDQTITRDLVAGDTVLVSSYKSGGITIMIGNQQALIAWDDTDVMERAVIMARQAVDPDTEIRLVPPPAPT
ncbi:MAG TPA: hypothetical protein VK970_02255, partial [Candidatus Methylacidiphilales bacterium]|nr:hypothetical protein [Candidatus Methylacidiphilales bacterium]